jgi:hypothetical protein
MNWTNEAKNLLTELLEPVPAFVRIMIKRGIKKKIEEVAKGENSTDINKEHVLHGFILASPKGSIDNVKKTLDSKNIDYSAYQHIIDSK